MKNICIYIYTLVLLCLTPFKSKHKMIENKELVRLATKERKSIIRFGDGEYRIMYSKKGIHYQNYDESLRIALFEIFKNYSSESDYIICLPPFFYKNIVWYLKNDPKYTLCFAKPRYLWRTKQDVNKVYGNAFVFGLGNERIYEKLWEKEENIIIVHNNKKWCDFFNQRYNKKAIFIETPSTDSFSKIDIIIRKIKEIDSARNYLTLISSGPMAKVLAYKLSIDGHHVIDTGHCFDDPII